MTHSSRPARWLRSAGALCAAGVLASACGLSSGRDFTIGFRRVALDLSYKDPALAKPASRQDVSIPQPIPSIASVLSQVSFPPSTTPQLHLPRSPLTCATAPADAHPEQPATVFVNDPPVVGTYTTHNKGQVTIGVALPLTIQIPSRGAITIQNITHSTTSDPLNGPTTVFTYDVYVPGLDGGTTTTYQVTNSPATLTGTAGQTAGGSHAPAGELDLVHYVLTSSAGNIDFTPNPPITIMAFKNGQGTSWNSAGVDQKDGTSMVVQGSVSQRKNIDLCGHVYDTYEVVSNEHLANVRTGLKSDTSTSDPNVYHVATNYGGLFIQQHIDTTAQITNQSTGAVTQVTAVYDQTFDSIKPFGAS